MSYTYEDFVMESAMVETTNETPVSDITMEQYTAEFNVACAAFDAFNKYALIAEYATCDVEEYIQESKYGPDTTTKLTGKIAKVGEWKNSGGKIKKVLGTIAEAVLKFIRMLARGLNKLFGKESSPVKRLIKWAKSKKDGKTLSPEKEAKKQAKEDKKNAKIASKQMEDDAYLAEGHKKRAEAYAGRVSELEKQNAKQSLQIISLKNQWKKKNAEIEKMNENLKKLANDLKNAKSNISDWQRHSAQLSKELKDTRADRDEATQSFHVAVRALKRIIEGEDETDPTKMEAIASELTDADQVLERNADLVSQNAVLMEDVYANINNVPEESQSAVREVISNDMKAGQAIAKLASDCGLRINDKGEVDF